MAFISQSTGLSVVANTETVVYNGTTNNANNGAPASGAVVIGLYASNISTAGSASVDIYIRNTAGVAGTDDVYVIKNAPVPSGSTLDVLPSKLVLNSGDIIYTKITVNSAIQVTSSLLEN